MKVSHLKASCEQLRENVEAIPDIGRDVQSQHLKISDLRRQLSEKNAFLKQVQEVNNATELVENVGSADAASSKSL